MTNWPKITGNLSIDELVSHLFVAVVSVQLYYLGSKKQF